MLIYYYKKWSLFTKLFCYIFVGVEKYTGVTVKVSRFIHCELHPVSTKNRICQKYAA